MATAEYLRHECGREGGLVYSFSALHLYEESNRW